MKTKNLISLSLLILIIVLGSYIIFNKQKKTAITETTTTVTTKLALCSNEYYDTEYDEEGKIVVKDLWNSNKIECSEQELESLPATGGNLCEIKRKDIKTISGLKCIQKLSLPGSNVATYYNDEDLLLLSQFENLEYFESEWGTCKNIFVILSNLKHLKSILTSCVIKNTSFLKNLPNLEYLYLTLWEADVQEINFKDIPLSIKELSFYDYDNGNYKITNSNQIINLINLEKFTWTSSCFDDDVCSNNLKNLFYQVIELAPSIKWINDISINDDIDRNDWINKIKSNNFKWESFIEQLKKSDRG